MALELFISHTAQNDIANIADFLAAENALLAVNAIERIERATALLCQNPNIGPVVQQPPQTGLRKTSVPPYIVFYRPTETRLIVVRVLHSSRDISEEDLRD